jgi:hypothetical protein
MLKRNMFFMEGLFVIPNRLGICYTHKKEGRKIIWAADSYLVVRFNDGIPAKRYKTSPFSSGC